MKTKKEIVTNAIKELGISANVQGYHYARHGILLMIDDMSLINSITKKLYPTIANEFKTTETRVERAIRHAINMGWERGNVEFQQKLFGYTVNHDKGCPTNSEFIITLADWFNMLQEETEKGGGE